MTALEEIRKEQAAQRELLEEIYRQVCGGGTAKPGNLTIRLAARRMLSATPKPPAAKRNLRLVKDINHGGK